MVLAFNTLACKKHWFEIPPELRRKISKFWREGKIDGYLQARSQAVVFLNGEIGA